MSLQLNTVNSRLVYANAIALLQKTGVTVDTAKLTQSFLRLEAQLVVNKTQFQFYVLNNQPGSNATGSVLNTEQRLNQQDSFVASSWGFFISDPASNVDTTAPLRTYPNTLYFPTAGSAAAAETLYNSYFQLAVNNTIILPAYDTNRFRVVPQTQHVAAAPAAADQIDGGSDAYYPVEPNIVFIGSKNNVLNLIIPAALAVVEPFERATVIFRGVLAQNSTIIT